MGKILIVIGIALVALGLLLQFAPGLLGWFGRLPGDIRVQGERGGRRSGRDRPGRPGAATGKHAGLRYPAG